MQTLLHIGKVEGQFIGAPAHVVRPDHKGRRIMLKLFGGVAGLVCKGKIKPVILRP